MISINATLIIQILNFLILVFILNRILFRPTLRLIQERTCHIEDAKTEVEKIEKETEELADKLRITEKSARTEARGESSQLKKEAISMSEKIMDDTRREIFDIRDQVEKAVQAQLEKARESLQSEALMLVDEITEKVIGRRIQN